MTHTHRPTLLLTLLLSLMTLACTFSLSFVSPPSPDPDHPFNTAAAYERLQRILGDEAPHPVDSNANDAVRDRLLDEIQALGFDPMVRDDFHCTDHFGGICARVQNILFWAVPPTSDADTVVALMSHYDSVPAGPGASDDGAGVAVGLEIAHILKGQDLPKPVLILITDGEEIGLLGAESFVQSDPLAARIDAVVNVEARGVRGPASMFQTSSPNGRDVGALRQWGRTALANTLSSDIYDAMPNDTDLSRFLDDTSDRSVDATNYAFILGDSFYHTPGDNLANLDQRSLFHSGINALASVEGFVFQTAQKDAESDRLYFDVLTLWLVAVPAWMGLGSILLCIGLCLITLIKTGDYGGWRGWLILPLSLIAGGLGAVALSYGVGLIKPSGAYAPAHPWALRGAQAAIAILFGLGVTLSLLKTKPSSDRIAHLLKAWVWLSLIGGLAWSLFPGSAVIFMAPLLIASLAAIAAFAGKETLSVILSLFAALIFFIINLPLPGFALAALGSMAAPFAALWAVPAAMMTLALIHPSDRRWPLSAIGGFTSILILLTVAVPTFSAQAPKALSLRHISFEDQSAVQIVSRDPVPTDWLNAQGFETRSLFETRIGRYIRPAWSKPVKAAPDINTQLEVISDQTVGDTRQIEFQIRSSSADRIHLIPANDAMIWSSLSINGINVKPSRWGPRITGRAARNLIINIELSATHSLGHVAVTRFGLNKTLSVLDAQRPDWTIPRQDGDIQIKLLALDGMDSMTGENENPER